MWVIILIVCIVLFVIGAFYLISRFEKFQIVRNLLKNKKGNSRVLGAILVIVFALSLYFWVGLVNTVICHIHLTLIWALCDFISILWRKVSHKKSERYYGGVCAIVFTAIYLTVGRYNAFNVSRTAYTVSSEKQVGQFRVAMISDSHIGTTFSGEELADKLKAVELENPDILVVVGDFVDDDTMKENMVAACKSLGNVKTKYGVYYVYGNHDKGYYGAKHRGYTADELASELEANNVIILEDENVVIDDRICLIGRQDASESYHGNERLPMTELIKDIDSNLYSVVLDHQPGDYENQQGLVDMVLSGHTHGGQFIPVTYVGEWIGVNDKTYGRETREGTDFIVSSGISDWAIYYKTGCKSEYVIIDIVGK